MFAPGLDAPITWYEGSGTSDRRFLSSDERGSIIAVSDSAGNALATNGYDEYGIPQSPASASAGSAGVGTVYGRFGYTGQAWIPEIGLYYYKTRKYSPGLGRFMQTDPIGYADASNPYVYVRNDPSNGSDPFGRNPLFAVAAGIVVDYGLQVAMNYAEGKSGTAAWTDVDVGEMLLSGALGAISGGPLITAGVMGRAGWFGPKWLFGAKQMVHFDDAQSAALVATGGVSFFLTTPFITNPRNPRIGPVLRNLGGYLYNTYSLNLPSPVPGFYDDLSASATPISIPVLVVGKRIAESNKVYDQNGNLVGYYDENGNFVPVGDEDDNNASSD